MNRANAFSLVEVAVCLVILGLLASVAVVSLAGVEKVKRAEDAIDWLAALDERTRSHTRRFGRPCDLLFDLESQTITRVYGTGNNDRQAFPVPRGARIEQIHLQGGDEADRQIALRYSPDGLSATYVITLRGPDGSRVWLAFAGATGQVFTLESEADAQALLDIR